MNGDTADTPVLDTLVDMTTAALEHNTLSPRELMLVRLAALIAVDAPPASYLLNAGPAADMGVTGDDVQGCPRCGRAARGRRRREHHAGLRLRHRRRRVRDGRGR